MDADTKSVEKERQVAIGCTDVQDRTLSDEIAESTALPRQELFQNDQVAQRRIRVPSEIDIEHRFLFVQLGRERKTLVAHGCDIQRGYRRGIVLPPRYGSLEYIDTRLLHLSYGGVRPVAAPFRPG